MTHNGWQGVWAAVHVWAAVCARACERDEIHRRRQLLRRAQWRIRAVVTLTCCSLLLSSSAPFSAFEMSSLIPGGGGEGWGGSRWGEGSAVSDVSGALVGR